MHLGVLRGASLFQGIYASTDAFCIDETDHVLRPCGDNLSTDREKRVLDMRRFPLSKSFIPNSPMISKKTMTLAHKDVPEDDSFGSVQASVGRFSALTGILGAWFLVFIALGFVAYSGVRVYQTRSSTSDHDKKLARTWLFWSGVAMAFCLGFRV